MSDQLLSLIATAALEDKAIKAALLKYIEALTAKEKPAEEWREVWWQETSIPRVYVDEDYRDPNTGFTHKLRDAYVYARVEYSKSHQVAEVCAYLTGTPYSKRTGYTLFDYGVFAKPFWTRAHNVTDYTDAIRCGQSDWATIMVEFEAMTELKDEETQNA